MPSAVHLLGFEWQAVLWKWEETGLDPVAQTEKRWWGCRFVTHQPTHRAAVGASLPHPLERLIFD